MRYKVPKTGKQVLQILQEDLKRYRLLQYKYKYSLPINMANENSIKRIPWNTVLELIVDLNRRLSDDDTGWYFVYVDNPGLFFHYQFGEYGYYFFKTKKEAQEYARK